MQSVCTHRGTSDGAELRRTACGLMIEAAALDLHLRWPRHSGRLCGHPENEGNENPQGKAPRVQEGYLPALHHGGHGHESPLHIGRVLRARLHERDSQLVRKRLASSELSASQRQKYKFFGVHRREITFAVSYGTALFSSRSHLFPTRSLLTTPPAYRSISPSHFFTLWKLSPTVTSYTTCQH